MHCQETLNFLLARMQAQHLHKQPRCYGISSDALVLWALEHGDRPQTPGWSDTGGRSWAGGETGRCYPHDKADMEACERTYEMAPLYLQEIMAPVLQEFRQWVHHKRNRYGALYPYARPPEPWWQRAWSYLKDLFA